MNPDQIKKFITENYKDVYEIQAWGETSFFYNPGKKLKRGVYFLTIKEKDGENDKSSNLDREDVYRLNTALDKDTFFDLFAERFPRPAKGKTISDKIDFTQLDKIMPHPVYGWGRWICVLNPSKGTFKEFQKYINISYSLAINRFEKRTK